MQASLVQRGVGKVPRHHQCSPVLPASTVGPADVAHYHLTLSAGRCKRGLLAPVQSTGSDGSRQETKTTTEDAPGANGATLSSLDALLGLSSGTKRGDGDSSSSDRGGRPAWWAARPKQAAPPRQTAMAPGSSGRFLANETVFTASSEVRVGAKTQVGDALILPEAQPVLSYALLLLTGAISATAAQLALMSAIGLSVDASLSASETALNFLHSLGLTSGYTNVTDITAGGFGGGGGSGGGVAAWQLVSALLVPGSSGAVALAMYGLGVVAPRVEAVMGYSAFLAVFLLSGLAGETALLAATPPSLEPHVCLGALPPLFGLLGCALMHAYRNADVERRSSRSQRNNSSSNDGFGSSSGSTTASAATTTTSSNAAATAADSSTTSNHSSKGSQGSSVSSGSENGGGVVGLVQQIRSAVPDSAWYAANAFVLAGCGLSAARDWSEVHGGAVGLPLALAVSFLAGAGLTAGLGPKYDVSVELDIPDGAMYVPEDVAEMVVVIDQTTSLQRAVVASGAAVTLAGAMGVVLALVWH